MRIDLEAIACLLEQLGTTSSAVAQFIDAARKSVSFSSLTEHPLLQSMNRTFEDFVVEKLLGSGGFGEVLQVSDTKVDRKYAVKHIKIDPRTKKNRNTLAKANQEVKTLAKLTAYHNKRIVRYYRSWTKSMQKSNFKSFKHLSVEEMDVDDDVDGQETSHQLPLKRYVN